MDSLHDGGYIEISYDSGATWKNVANDSLINFKYDSNTGLPIISNGNAAFTGGSYHLNSGQWEYEYLYWCYPDAYVFGSNLKPVYLRFVFSSDSIQTNREGWIIDNINLYTDFCEGVNELSNISNVFIYPSISSGLFQIKTNEQLKKILITDGVGRIVFSSSVPVSEINFSNVADGIYFYAIEDDKEMVWRGMIVKN